MHFFAVTAILIALSTTPSWARTIDHILGSTEVPTPPQRVVILEFSFVDALAALQVKPIGLADDKKRQRIGSEYTSIFGHEWTSVGTRKTPSLEIIASLQPDLIIADQKRHASIYKTLSEIAPTIVLDSLGGDYQQSLANLKTISFALFKEDAFQKRLAQHRKKMNAYAKQIKDLKGTSVVFGVANSQHLWLHSPTSYNGSLLQFFGFQSNISKDSGNYVKTSLEQLSNVNPDVFIIGEYSDPSVLDLWAKEELYQEIKASRHKRIHTVDPHRWTRMRGMISAELKAKDLLRVMTSLR